MNQWSASGRQGVKVQNTVPLPSPTVRQPGPRPVASSWTASTTQRGARREQWRSAYLDVRVCMYQCILSYITRSPQPTREGAAHVDGWWCQ